VERFRTAPVERGDLLSTISATGTVEPEEVVDVGAQVMGRIRDLGVDLDAEQSGSTPESGETQPNKMASVTVAYSPPVAKPQLEAATEVKPRHAVRNEAVRRTPDARPRIDYGSTVHIDTELAYIDDTRYRAQFEQAQAALDRSLADLGQLEAKAAHAAAELRRAERLRSIEQTRNPSTKVPIVAISGSDYDLAVANDKVAKANLGVGKAVIEQNRAALNQAKTDLDYTIIKSPVEGVIVDRRVNIGQTVVAALNAPSLFLIAKDLSRMQVWASVNEADIGRIHKGMEVQFTVDAYPEEKFQGRVKQIRLNAQMTQNVVTYTVVIETGNPGGKLLPYLTANVLFHVEKRSGVLLVPNAALRWAPQSHQIDPAASAGSSLPAESSNTEDRGRVWVLTSGGLVRPLEVAIGASDGAVTEISGEGVAEGMLVVVGEQGQEGETVGDDQESRNPFLPKLPKGAKPPPGPM
jgi:HlyD family secretion protein